MNVTETERFLYHRIEALENKLVELETTNKILEEENKELKLMQLRGYLILSEDKNRHEETNKLIGAKIDTFKFLLKLMSMTAIALILAKLLNI